MPNWPCHDDSREKEVYFVLSCFVRFCIFEACTSYKTGASEGFYMWWTFIMFLNIVCINTVTQKISSKHCCFFSCVILLGHNKGVHHSPKWTIEVHFAWIISNKKLDIKLFMRMLIILCFSQKTMNKAKNKN